MYLNVKSLEIVHFRSLGIRFYPVCLSNDVWIDTSMFTNVAKGVWNISVKKKQGLKKLSASCNVGN